MLRLALLLFFAVTAFSQTPTPTPAAAEPTRLPMWRCELPGGTYEVALRSIVSVSSHEYVVDAAARVTEVNVDTSGSLVVRFYLIEPNVPTSPLGIGQSLIDKVNETGLEAADRTGQSDLWRKVVKSYPTTTHARTVEYRLGSKEEIDKLFKSAESAFRLGKNTTVKIP